MLPAAGTIAPMKAANTAGRLRLSRGRVAAPAPPPAPTPVPPPAPAPESDQFATAANLLKALLGLSGIVYLAGFIVANAHFLALGVAEATLVDARYIAAGALFLFLGLPVTLFPYLSGLAAMNREYMAFAGRSLSPPLDDLYQANRKFLQRKFGPFVVALCVLVVLPELGGSSFLRDGIALLIAFFPWYVGSWILSRFAVVVFNFGFYWRVKLLSESAFWTAFGKAFRERFEASFRSSFKLAHQREPTDAEIEQKLRDYQIATASFLASALYRGVALFVIHAITFATFVYPLVPASIGGGQAQQVVLLIPKDKALGLERLGLRGKTVIEPGEILDNAPGRLLTEPLPLLTKTAEAYLVKVQVDGRTTVLRIPAASVEGASYRGSR